MKLSDKQSKIDCTKQLLTCFSSHLSGREECRRLEYRVTIAEDDIVAWPVVQVFPDRFRRKQADRSSILHHVIAEHFSWITCPKFSSFSSTLVTGVYVYKLSDSKKRRTWVKIK